MSRNVSWSPDSVRIKLKFGRLRGLHCHSFDFADKDGSGLQCQTFDKQAGQENRQALRNNTFLFRIAGGKSKNNAEKLAIKNPAPIKV